MATEGKKSPPTTKERLADELAYSPAGAADWLGVTTSTLAKWRCEGRGPAYVKVGRAISYRGRDLNAYFDKCRVEVAA